LLLPAGWVTAQEEDLEVEMFFASEETVTSAARHEQEIGMSPSAVTVFTREDIETTGAGTVPDLLRLVPGMDVITVSPAFTAITSRLYWTNENNLYLVLIDGREMNLELMGEPPWEILPISMEDIERIEVIRGPGSSLYGPNAVAGVISITTRPVGEQASAFLGFSGGEIGSSHMGARASTRLGDWGFSFNGGFERSGTFTDHRLESKRVYRVRGTSEYRLSGTERILAEGSFARGDGALTTGGMGDVDGYIASAAVRLAYESETLRGRLYWNNNWTTMRLTTTLDYGGIPLADFAQAFIDANTVDGEVQWTLPRFWSPLLLITGGGLRVSWLHSDEFLDGDTYADITSSDYHQPGITHMEVRAGAFVHGELSPTDWLTGTFGLRFDYNNITDTFLSPRLAVVFQPIAGQFLRLGVARAFRMPSFRESNTHIMVEFPDESPITGPGQQDFLEFMSRAIGNPDVDNEKLWAFEAGYLGRFLDSKLTVNLELYCNVHTDVINLETDIVPDQTTGLPDLDASDLSFANSDRDIYILGSELTVRYKLSKSIMLLANWAHREVFYLDTGEPWDTVPKNLMALGGRFHGETGLVGSLYLHSRSKFRDAWVENPHGLLEPAYEQNMPNIFMVFGRLGWMFKLAADIHVEAGLKVFLPVSPFQAPHFRVREKGGAFDHLGHSYGGQELIRVLTAYLQGSY
jgi:iron complex outermembrane receptor protein